MKGTSEQNSSGEEISSKWTPAGSRLDTSLYSIASKRSVEKVYYPHEPSFSKPFVPKLKRRAPLINRGYWLRIKAIDTVIEKFLRRPTAAERVIVNLGCGYDALPFRFHWKGLAQGVKFVDIDYRELIVTKVRLMTDDKHLRTILESWSYSVRENEDENVILTSKFYDAVSCNINDVDRLHHIFSKVIPLQGCEIMFLVEDAFVIMEPHEAAAIIEWASMFEKAHFCLLEQCLSCARGLDHPFVVAMEGKLSTKDTPPSFAHLLSLDRQWDRFHNAGWASVNIRSLWNLWQDPAIIDQEELLMLNRLELFDEWEDFVLFAEHYFILQASVTAPKQPDGSIPTFRQSDNGPSDNLSISKLQIAGHKSPKTSHARRFGAVSTLSTESVSLQGGIPSSRDFELYTSGSPVAAVIPPNNPQSQFFHTITAVTPTQHLLVGGRSSPTKVSGQCWKYDMTSNHWARIHDISPARYRHSAVDVTIGDQRCVLVFGGRDQNGKELDDWQVWSESHGWRKLNCNNEIRPRFGAAMITIDGAKGVVLGGIDGAGRILEDAWHWSVTEQLQVLCTPISLSGSKTAARFGATFVASRWGNLLIGGVSSAGLIPQREDLLIVQSDGATRLLNPLLHRGTSWPLLIGSSIAAVSGGDILIIGGGAVCFSHGTFMNDSWYTIQEAGLVKDASQTNSEGSRESLPLAQFRRLTKDDLNISESSSTGAALRKFRETNGESLEEEYQELKLTEGPPRRADATFSAARNFLQNCPIVQKVPSQNLSHTTDISNLLSDPHPVNFLVADHPSKSTVQASKWTLDHLNDKVGRATKVSIHDSNGPHMKFAGAGRNIEYATIPFGHFTTLLHHGHHCYLRALSASQSFDRPADFWRDFPGLGPDFAVPEVLKQKFGINGDTFHSAVLRISGDVTMWVHYDVMSNLLFQLAGTKQVLLFPPLDIIKLGFAPGKTASPLNVFEELESCGIGTSAVDALTLASPELGFLRGARPYSVLLEPGHALYIPRFWAHATAPDALGVPSVAVNVFWRDLTARAYSLRKDVYGSLDLRCYEIGRVKVQKAVTLLGEARRLEAREIAGMLRMGEISADYGGNTPDLRSLGLDRLREAVMGAVPADVAEFYLLRLSEEFEGLVDETYARPP